MHATIDIAELDDGPAAARRGVARLCLACSEVKPVEEMIRYVVGPDGRVVPDLECKLPGRGAWVTATRAALERAINAKAFGRTFRGRGSVGADLADLVDRLLERAALDALSIANKAGRVVTGFARVEAALAEHDIMAVVHASDAAADGVRKLDAAAARAAEASGSPRPVRIRTFAGAQLDLALGRSNVVHAALLAHPASAGFLARCLRLDHWRSGGPAGETTISASGETRP